MTFPHVQLNKKFFANFRSLKSWSHICPIYDWNVVVTVHADGLAPNGARPSAGTVMTKNLLNFLIVSLPVNNFRFIFIIQNDRQSLRNISTFRVFQLFCSSSDNLRGVSRPITQPHTLHIDYSYPPFSLRQYRVFSRVTAENDTEQCIIALRWGIFKLTIDTEC